MEQRDTYGYTAFNFWECGRIGINVVKNNKLHAMYDLTLDEAKDLARQLIAACLQFEEFEEQAREHDRYMEETEDVC